MENFNNADCLGFLPLLKMKHFLNQAFFFFFSPRALWARFFTWFQSGHYCNTNEEWEHPPREWARAWELLAQQASLLPNCPPDPAADHTGAQNKYDSVHNKNPQRPGAAQRGSGKGPSLPSDALMAARHQHFFLPVNGLMGSHTQKRC